MNWQEVILSNFAPKHDPMLLVVDPDNLLRDDALLAEIQNRNYDVLELQDEVAFRNLFERSYRSRWDAGEERHVIIIVHTLDKTGYIPFDLWKKGKRIELNVADLFSHLNAIVVRGLDNAYYTDLFPAHQQLVERNERLHGERQTIEFILRVVFGLDPVTAADPNRWVEFLIHKYYSAREIPPALEIYIQEHLLPRLAQAALRPEFLTSSAAFYDWLGEQWTRYVATQEDGAQAAEGEKPLVDFSDLRLRPLLGFLFAEGLVSKTPLPAGRLPEGEEWLAVGLSTASSGEPKKTGEAGDAQTLYNLNARLKRLQTLDEGTLPAGKNDLRDWLNLAAEWAEVIYQANRLPHDLYTRIQAGLAAARRELDGHFWEFLQKRYSAVDHYQDQKGPISVAAVNRWLYQSVAAEERLALVCLDGMALDGWYLLRDYLTDRLPDVQFNENRVYAMAPTITPVSRQALFAGRPPAAFSDTIGRTDQDDPRWRAYWVNHNIPPRRIAYLVVKPSDAELSAVKTIAEGKNLRLGILINLFDDVMHATEGMPPEADKRILYDSVSSQLEHGYLDRLFALLLNAGYRVFVTADHGSIAGVGCGITPPRALVEDLARRVVLFDQESLAAEFAARHNLRAFRTKSLPPEVFPVYPTGEDMFFTNAATRVSHGGLSLEELVAPFVELLRPETRPA